MIAFNSCDFSKPFLGFPLTGFPLTGFPRICFTAIDQALLIWGALTLMIFSMGQFSTLSWAIQATLDAALTGMGIATTSGLTWAIANQAKLRWVIVLWATLMSIGTVVTIYGTFCGSALILSNLCLLWVALCAAGYGAMAIGMRSRCFTAAFWMHVSAMIGLSHAICYAPHWQFLNSGLVIATPLFFFSVVPWDMETDNNLLSTTSGLLIALSRVYKIGSANIERTSG